MTAYFLRLDTFKTKLGADCRIARFVNKEGGNLDLFIQDGVLIPVLNFLQPVDVDFLVETYQGRPRLKLLAIEPLKGVSK